MATQKSGNNLTSTLDAQLLSGGTSITLQSGQGANWSAANGTNYILAVLRNSMDTKREVVKVTNRSGDTLTVVRNQETIVSYTPPYQFEVGDTIEARVTAGMFDFVADANNTVPSQSGNSGEFLTTDGSTLSWGAVAIPGIKNIILNGSFQIDQRKSTSIADDVYCLDRWYCLNQSGNTTVAQQTLSEDGQPTNIRLTQPDASAKRIGLAQIIEGKNCTHLRGQTVNFSFRGKCSSSQAVRFAILEWTGTEDSVTSDVVNDWTSSTYTTNNFFINNANLTIRKVDSATPSAATWTWFSTSTTLGSSFTNLIVFIWMEGTLVQNGTLDLGLVQLEPGANRTLYAYIPFDVEWRRCLRYYEKSFKYSQAPTEGLSYSSNLSRNSCPMYTYSATQTYGTDIPFMEIKRATTPTLTFYGTSLSPSGKWAAIQCAVDMGDATPTIYNQTEYAFRVTLTGLSGGTTNSAGELFGNWTAECEL